MKKIVLLLLFTLTFKVSAQLQDLLISEIAITPTAGEFIEIHNKGANVLDLTDVYITDATFAGGGTYYYQLVTGGGGGGGYADFFARFPTGATIAPGAYQTIALNGALDFNNVYGIDPTYEIANSDNNVPDMLEARPGSIDGLSSGLSDGGEVVVLFHWDGVSDLVQDLDYVLWGDKVEAIDKTAVSIDGPDPDSTPSTYLDDTPISAHAITNFNSHADGNSWQRSDMNEGNEVKTGGNGINGHDETSEDINNTFFEASATPNAAAGNPPAPQIIINEVDALGTAEFIELKGPANATTNGITLVMYDGDTDQIYGVYDLSVYSLSADGYFLIGDASLSPDITLSANSLEDGADAVAIYYADSSQFSVGGSLTTTDIMDALVYDSGQPDDLELLTLMNNGQPQINENSHADAANQSMARCPDGSGGSLNSSTYQAVSPTPGLLNNLCPLGNYYATADPSDAITLRNSLHEIIDDHTSFPYSGGTTDTWDVLSFADADPSDPNKVWMVYKNNSYTWQGGGQQAYNREHTWPQSRGFSSGSLGANNAARTDMHHLMLSDVGYNSDRGNKYFDNCLSGCTELPTTANHGVGGPGQSNWTNGTVFEVWDFRKGDIARAMFYMDVRYAGDISGEPNLQLTDNLSLISGSNPYMGLLSVLIDWHNQDPVDSYELERNERIYSYQGNRNPFIDHPEWVECIFVPGGQCSPVINDLIFKNGFE